MTHHEVDAPVTVLEFETLSDGRQRLSIGTPTQDGTVQVLHLVGELRLEAVESRVDCPLRHALVMRTSPKGPILMELRIEVPDAEPEEPEEPTCHD